MHNFSYICPVHKPVNMKPEENIAKTISNRNQNSAKSDMFLNDIIKRQIVSGITGKFKV